MTDTDRRIAEMRRPALLIRAARHGLDHYDRVRDLRRALPDGATQVPGHALGPLLDAEARLDDARRAGDAAYSPARHVELLIAVMAEARAGRETAIGHHG